MFLAEFNNYSKISKTLCIFLVFLGIAIFIALSISTDRLYLIIALGMVGMFFMNPIYILFLIIILNPFSDWIVVNYPSLFSKVMTDIFVVIFILVTMARKIAMRKSWIVTPFHKWVFVLLIFYLMSGFLHWTNIEDFMFMNWVHFRFVYLAVGITQLNLNDRKYYGVIKVLILVYFIHLAIGLFQVVGGEWAKDLVYQGSQNISLSYGLLHYSNYDTAFEFNLAGFTYIYSTFFSPSHFGSFLLLMICLVFGMRKARLNFQANKYSKPFIANKMSVYSVFIKKKYYCLILILTTIEICLTFNRSTYIGFFVLISFIIISSGSSLRKLVIYEIVLIAVTFSIFNMESLINYLEGVSNPGIGTFDPIARGLSIFSTYFLQDTPRKIAYWNILPRIITETPLFGLGVTSVLNQENIVGTTIVISDSLRYVYGDAGLVRLFVEFGMLGSLIFGLLFFKVFNFARKGYILANKYEERVLCFAVVTGIITLVPVSIGTMLIISKSYGLYLWMFIGFSQRWRVNNQLGCLK